jgi:3-oxoacyl-[acyl-carrier-protein] synthase II
LAVIAAKLAAEDAGLVTRGSEEGASGFAIDGKRSGCQIGAGLIAAETEELSRAMVTAATPDGRWDLSKWGTVGEGAGGGMNNLPPLWLLKYLPNMLACHVTIIHGLEGPSNTITCAEASGLLSIGEAARVIERGDADLCFAGGAESKINLMGHLRLELAKRLAATGEATEAGGVVRPFEAQSLGGVPGEGGGILVLEGAEHARKRGARVYAEVAGFGAAQSATPVFPGLFDPPRAEAMEPGERRAISGALRDAGVRGAEVDGVFPLGIGVPMLDAAEAGAIEAALGDGGGARWRGLARVTLSERVGNCMAGHGGLTAAAGALAVAHGRMPGASAGAGPVRSVVVCTHALGGQAAALVLRAVG